MSQHYILMGDIIRSHTYDARILRHEFIELVSSCNQEFERSILSPYTVTLGDEFQGVSRSLRSLLNSIFYLEETALQRKLQFRMRFVAVHGLIDTPINKLKAHSMMGTGLTRARMILTDKRRGTPRFRFELTDGNMTKHLTRLFLVIDGLILRWKPDEGPLLLEMVNNTNNEDVGIKYKKNRTQIWKRRKHLFIDEYRALKETILDLAE